MPKGTPVATMGANSGGAANGALMAARILAVEDEGLSDRLLNFRQAETQSVLDNPDPEAAWEAAERKKEKEKGK